MENQEIVDGVFKNLAEGKAVVAQDVKDSLDMEKRFYILGAGTQRSQAGRAFLLSGQLWKHIKAYKRTL